MAHPFEAYLESNDFADDDLLFITAYKRAELTSVTFGREYLLSVADWRKRDAVPPPAPVALRAAYDGLRVRVEPRLGATIVAVLELDDVVQVDATRSVTADEYVWRQLADGRGWAAERKVDGSKVFLVPLA